MKHVRWNKHGYKEIGKSLLVLANVVAGSLVFGQFITKETFSGFAFIIGIVATIVLYYAAIIMFKQIDV